MIFIRESYYFFPFSHTISIHSCKLALFSQNHTKVLARINSLLELKIYIAWCYIAYIHPLAGSFLFARCMSMKRACMCVLCSSLTLLFVCAPLFTIFRCAQFAVVVYVWEVEWWQLLFSIGMHTLTHSLTPCYILYYAIICGLTYKVLFTHLQSYNNIHT